MQTDIQEIYQKTILPLSEKEKLRIAALILEDVTGSAKNERGELEEDRETYGMWMGEALTKEEYLQLDHNEQIDFDLGNSYGDDHEDED